MQARRPGQSRLHAVALCALARDRAVDAGAVRRRVFVVGCPRSGTTLVQSLLHAHRDIQSLPETHFFQRLVASEDTRRCEATAGGTERARRERRERMRRALAAAGIVDARRARRAWRDLGDTGLVPDAPRGLDAWRLDAHARAFVAAMDRLCLQHGKSVWLEKTPDHLFYVEAIRRCVPDARFIHVVRDGEEVVASLHRAAREHAPWRPFLDLDRCIGRWGRAVAESLRWIDDPRHRLVRYEDLVAAPEATLRQVLAFIGCAEDARLWQRHPRTTAQLITPDEPWKRGNLQPIAARRRFEATFDRAQQQRVRDGLARIASRLAAATGTPPPMAQVRASFG
ncbi:MAG TPA: sulfotransferase [Lysobacter sp.]